MLFWLFACAPKEGLEFSPATLAFGEVDFAGEMPDGGYATEDVELSNAGKTTVSIELPAYDKDRLCLTGFDADGDFPVDLGDVDPGSTYRFTVGVCFYVAGEIDTEVATELVVDSDDGSVTLPITFTPIRTSE
jgi:hypothetical protein